MIYPIKNYGSAILREPAQKIEMITAEHRTIAEKMIETMRDAEGVGLAAEQVGLNIALFVLEIPVSVDSDEAGERLYDLEMPVVMINPEITGDNGYVITSEEGCLSFPGISARVERREEVTVQYQNLKGEKCEVLAKGLLSRAVQHELDHLKGVLLVDRMSAVKKVALKGRLKRLVRQTKQEE